mgnify:CR=1 FL=1
MTDAEILAKLTRILRELLGNDGIVLGMETRRGDVVWVFYDRHRRRCTHGAIE